MNIINFDHIQDMQTTFAFKDLGNLNYFLRVEVTKAFDGIHLPQTKYIDDLLAKNGMAKCSSVPTSMSTGHCLTKDSGMLLKIHLNTGVL